MSISIEGKLGDISGRLGRCKLGDISGMLGNTPDISEQINRR